jgi:hypothetical protein
MLLLSFFIFMLSSSLHAQIFLMTVEKSGNGTGTVASENPGIYCGPDCTRDYAEGEHVILTAIADPGSVFVGWNGSGCQGDRVCPLIMASDLTVTATFSLLGSLSVNEGTIGTQITIADSGFGTKKGKVTVGGKSCKVLQWANESITFEIKTALAPGLYDVVVQLKEPKGASPITYEGAFTMMAPEIVTVNPGSAPTREIEVTGLHFGTKKGAVYFVNPENGRRMICRVTEHIIYDYEPWPEPYEQKENVYLTKCKVKEWNMDQATGESTLTFVVGRFLRAGTYGVEVVNKIDKTNALFTVN